ncbi:PAS domain-containing protein [Piscinibacter sp. HJYY11]|uniref:PAS domain-containing protein n=1 Tax=Piscinibacter sp. HJYY11 TaxID=2801333 RepID=UPI00191E3941|nr:PAS domain-containing protein [Piscinibacter sp. HJYY11]MBL0727268.1 PAS domain-containing protein [Piscinibacter sp. HJYY11]
METRHMAAQAIDLAFLAGDSEMARRIREFDWSRTPLGGPEGWPASLRVMVRMALTTGHPVFLFWGPEHICLYNDAYRASLGPEKHPSILGMRGQEAWPEIWDIIGPQIASVHSGGLATWHENQLVPIIRNGKLEDVYWTYSYGPIDDVTAPSGIGGVLVLCTETTEQVMAAQAVEREREKFLQLFQQAPVFIALLSGPAHVFDMANPAYLSLLGNRDLVGKAVAEALPEAGAQGYIDLLDQVYRTGQPHEALGAEYQFKLPGEPVRRLKLDFLYQPVFNDDDTVRGILVVGIDATSRYQALDELAVREEQLRLATDAGDVGLWDVDLVADTLHWPARVKAMFGISPQVKVTLRDFEEGLHPEDRERVMTAFRATADPVKRPVYDVEYRTVGKEDGQIRWISARGRGQFDDAGTCTRVVGAVIDITERKRVEQNLQELNDALGRKLESYLAEKKLLADIVEGTDAFVQVADRSFRWLAINEASAREFEKIFGIRPSVGDNMLELLANYPEHQAAVRSVWQRALSGEEFNEVGVFGEHVRRHYEMRFRSLRGNQGELIGAYQFVYDVTARVESAERLARAEASLAQAQKMEAVGQLTGGIAHDFNNLLQAIQGNFEIIRRSSDNPEMVLRIAQKGKDVTTRASKLTAQLLTFSREHAFDSRPLSVGDLLGSLQQLLQTTLGSTVELSLGLPDEDLWLLADSTQLEMAILNLAINARDAMGGVGTFHIGVRRLPAGPSKGPRVELTFTDNGPGMPPEVQSRCFDPFFTTKGVGKGSGLGLSQVYGMCERAGGSVSIRSSDDNGTTIAVELPEFTAPDRVRAAPEDAWVPSLQSVAQPVRVLIVDDDDDVREVLCAAVRSLGHEVHASSDGPSGLKAVEALSPDILLVDFAMPGMNGAEVARRALQTRPGLRVAFASGRADASAIYQAVGENAVLLRKPFDMEVLRLTLTALRQ